jgi:hypothetical protein
MKSVENILQYIREQFYRFSRGCKPWENLWNCSRKYARMFKTDSFLGNKNLSFNHNVWRDHATMQQDVLLHFWVIFLYWNQAEIWRKYSVVQLYSFFIVYPPLFHCLPLWTTVRLHGKKLQNATKSSSFDFPVALNFFVAWWKVLKKLKFIFIHSNWYMKGWYKYKRLTIIHKRYLTIQWCNGRAWFSSFIGNKTQNLRENWVSKQNFFVLILTKAKGIKLFCYSK